MAVVTSRDDVHGDVRALLQIAALLLPVAKRLSGLLPAGPDRVATLQAIEEAERELADRSLRI